MTVKELATCDKTARIVCGEGTMQRSEGKEVLSLTANSLLCEKGSCFFCLTGGKKDGHVYAKEAVEKGATVVVVERELELSVPQIVVENTREAMSKMASRFYGNPAEKLKIIGITGTNGKTTTAWMLASILRKAGKKVGIIGTLGTTYGKKFIAPELTTPDPIFLHETFADMLKSGVEYVVMEVSAHAIFYRKDEGIFYEACIFTNLSQDHLDFFENMKEYKETKKKLFDEKRCPIAILNGDDPVGREFGRKRAGKTYYYGLETPCEAFAIPTSEELYGSESMLNIEDELCRASLPMGGRFNLYNALAAALCARKLGVAMDSIGEGIKEVKVAGRMEWVESWNGGDIFVDFAHTPDGLKKLLATAKNVARGKVYCLFGCGGDRDKKKRQTMGETSARYADFSILTSDNPRGEDPMEILMQIEKGARKFSTAYVVIPDRKRATAYAIKLLKKGDVLLVAGKGAEDTQEIMGIKYAYNDKATIEEIVSIFRSQML